jgi:predicted component of type VI protein secretion system
MNLRYKKRDGTQVVYELGERAITIGRSTEADLAILDDKASRVHCGIRMWDGEFFLKDLKSRNGTFVNGQSVDMVRLNPGDRIRIGSVVFSFEAEPGKGTDTILREIEDEMDQGKGYTTILKEVVEEADEGAQRPAPLTPRRPAAPPAAPEPESEPEPAEESPPAPAAPDAAQPAPGSLRFRPLGKGPIRKSGPTGPKIQIRIQKPNS